MNVINKNSYQPSDKYFSNPSTNYYVVKKKIMENLPSLPKVDNTAGQKIESDDNQRGNSMNSTRNVNKIADR